MKLIVIFFSIFLGATLRTIVACMSKMQFVLFTYKSCLNVQIAITIRNPQNYEHHINFENFIETYMTVVEILKLPRRKGQFLYSFLNLLIFDCEFCHPHLFFSYVGYIQCD